MKTGNRNAARAAALALACSLPLGGAARAQILSNSDCRPRAEIEAKARENGVGAFAPLTTAQRDFARGVYVATPPIGPYPAGEDAEIAKFESGASVVLFLRGDEVCGEFSVMAPITKLLLDFDKSI